ncbi:MAG: DUF424 family protein [Nanoarchaeota archaeon]|nr:DUF424 family protein [Nanoarchaeota archaeon]
MEKEFLVKVHESYRDVVSVCDIGLIGKKIVEGNFQLDLTGEFYKGEEVDEEKLKEIIEYQSGEDATFNVVGDKSIEVFKNLGLVLKEGVRRVGGVSFALVLV